MAQGTTMEKPTNAWLAKRSVDSNFKRRGVITAISSGMFYGTYTAFMTLGMFLGIWAVWGGESSPLSPFAKTFLVGALGAALTDTCSAGWALGIAALKGKIGDFFRCIKTKPGLVMVAAAVIGGPLASTAYVVGLQKAGSIVVPISALCPAIGAILGKFLFKQHLNARMLLGIAICFTASAMIGSTGFGDSAPDNLFVGMFFGFIAAFCWGIEGCVCGYGTSMIDPEVGITIRQVTSCISNMGILVPTFAYFAGINPLDLVHTAFTDKVSIVWFIVAGFGSYFGFMLWYKGNAMCGAALGMSCNGAFSFWGPFFCWLVLGVLFGFDGWNMAPIAWAAAIIMVVGIFTIAMNPLELFTKKSFSTKPLNYAILRHFTAVSEASADDVMTVLKSEFSMHKAFNKADIVTALMTAEANGLLEESRYELDENQELRVFFKASPSGLETILKYIKA